MLMGSGTKRGSEYGWALSCNKGGALLKSLRWFNYVVCVHNQLRGSGTMNQTGQNCQRGFAGRQLDPGGERVSQGLFAAFAVLQAPGVIRVALETSVRRSTMSMTA